MSDNYTVKLKRRPWYAWLLWAVWLFLLIFIAQNAITSGQELEGRAAMIFWISFAVLFIAGLVVAIVRRNE
ncbi:MAG: hypothetical protein RRC07_01965 [Anaerolineae bacterium]|nr:hypothetical protein [Anaerolineae bacterium]